MKTIDPHALVRVAGGNGSIGSAIRNLSLPTAQQSLQSSSRWGQILPAPWPHKPSPAQTLPAPWPSAAPRIGLAAGGTR